jgi:hypothetical protein
LKWPKQLSCKPHWSVPLLAAVVTVVCPSAVFTTLGLLSHSNATLSLCQYARKVTMQEWWQLHTHTQPMYSWHWKHVSAIVVPTKLIIVLVSPIVNIIMEC